MKKTVVILFTVLSALFVLLTLCANAAAGITENKDYGGDWVVDGDTYTCRERIAWPDFGFYSLGNADGKIGLYMEMTVADKSTEPKGLGGDAGFLVGVTDENGDGIISENEDTYYLIDISSSNDGGFIGIEKNEKKWSDWKEIDHSSSFQKGASVGLTLIYDPDTAYFAVYITEIDENGNRTTEAEPWIEWTDNVSPLKGTGYGICSKITGGVFRNVRVTKGDEVAPPQAQGIEPAYDPNASTVMLADFSDPNTIRPLLGTGHNCDLEYDETNGCLKVTVTGRDPFFKVPMNAGLYFDGDRYTTIVLVYKTEDYSTAEIFYTSKDSRDIVRNHILFNIDESEDFTEAEVEMLYDDYDNWHDQIRSIRIDPTLDGMDGEVYYFKSVYVKTGEEPLTETVSETQTADETDAETADAVTAEHTEAETKESAATREQSDTREHTAPADNNNKEKTAVTIAIVAAAAAVIAAICVAVIIKKRGGKTK